MRIHQRTLGFALVTLLAASASATMMTPMSTQQLYHAADVVALVNVKEVTSVRTKGRITTHVQLSIAQAFKSTGDVSEGAVIEVLSPGGVSDGLTQHVEGAAQFAEGEKAIVFLNRVADGVYQVVSLEQGKFTLQTLTSGQQVVHRNLASAYVQRANGGLVEAAPPPAQEALDSFVSTLHTLAGASR